MRTLLIAALLLLSACNRNTVPPEQAATEFARALGMPMHGAPVCAAVDTDCDDYVSCTIVVVENDRKQLVSLQCAALEVGSACIRGEALGCKLTVASGGLP